MTTNLDIARVLLGAAAGLLAASSLYTGVQLVAMVQDAYTTRRERKARRAPPRVSHQPLRRGRLLTP